MRKNMTGLFPINVLHESMGNLMRIDGSILKCSKSLTKCFSTCSSIRSFEIYIYSERNRAGPRPAVAHASCGFAVGQFNIAGSKLLPSIPKAG